MPVTHTRRLRRTFHAALLAVALTAGLLTASVAAATPQREPQPVGQKTTWRLGSFVLPPAPLGLAQVNHPEIELAKPCEDCLITGFVPRLVYADGTPADMRTGVMLHHIGLFDPLRPDPAEQRCSWGGPIFGSGDEREPWFVMPPGFGYRPAPGPWMGFAELMNHGPVTREVHLEADVYSVPASTPGVKTVTPIMLSVADACASMEYDAPAGRSVRSMTWTAPVTGRIVWALGHVHAGGMGVMLTNASTGKRICGSRAGYGSAGEASSGEHSHPEAGSDPMANQVTSMSTCSWDSLGTVRAGEKLVVTSLYDSPRPLPGVMGIMSLAIHETSDLAGGTPAPASMRRVPDTKVPAAVGESGAGHGGHGGHGH